MRIDGRKSIDDILQEVRIEEEIMAICKRLAIKMQLLKMYFQCRRAGMDHVMIARKFGIGLGTLAYYENQIKQLTTEEFLLIRTWAYQQEQEDG